MARYIPQNTITTFCKRARDINQQTKKQRMLAEKMKKALKKGYLIPNAGPYTIDLAACGGKEFSWKDAMENYMTGELATRLGVPRKVARAMATIEMEKMFEKAPDKPKVRINGKDYIGGVKLNPRINKKFRTVEVVEEEEAA